MPAETLDIIVVPRDRFSVTRRCLAALAAHTPRPYRVLIVAGGLDRDSERELCALAAQDDALRPILVDHLVLQGEARNLALREARGRFCVIMENDTLVHAGWLPPLFHCQREEGAAVVTPLLWWYRGLHAAGGSVAERPGGGPPALTHAIAYSDIRRRRVDYPENHCLLLDREQLPGDDLFDEVEPFDVDLGLTLSRRGLSGFLEPRSMATYAAPPPIEVRDLPPFELRWDWSAWEQGNLRFEKKWGVTYDRAAKRASYRRQRLKFGLAAWRPGRATVWATNAIFSLSNRVQTVLTRRKLRSAGIVPLQAPELDG